MFDHVTTQFWQSAVTCKKKKGNSNPSRFISRDRIPNEMNIRKRNQSALRFTKIMVQIYSLYLSVTSDALFDMSISNLHTENVSKFLQENKL